MTMSSSEGSESDESGVCWTAGVQSTVVDEQGENVGHVLLIDCDDATVMEVFSLATALDGLSAIFESSEGSYHIWHLSVDQFDKHILHSLSLKVGDDAHAGVSKRRGYFVLRFVRKLRDDGEAYKERPTLCGIVPTEAPHEQSRPHYEALLSLAQEQNDTEAIDMLTDLPVSYDWIGSPTDLRIDRYGTVTDATKGDLDG